VTRLVKWHPSRHGTKACYNELTASRLGQLIGAPILRGGVVYVPDEIIPPDHRADGATPGFHFGVTRMEGENFIPAQHDTEIENASELPFAAAHLAWLAVGDQQGHNQYLQRLEIKREGYPPVVTKRFKLVDMGQMFGNFSWTAPAVSAVHPAYALPPHLAAKLTLAKLAPAIRAVKTVLAAAIGDCFSDCPEEWHIPADDKHAGAQRAIAAAAQIEQIIKVGNPAIQ
jgi:hypothetical protein